MPAWASEIGRAWRASLRKPGFLLLATAVLALGIGSTTAVFALLQGTLLKPLPYPHAGRLAAAGMVVGDGSTATSPQMFQHLQGMSGVESIGVGTSLAPTNVFVDGHAIQVPTARAGHDLLPTLGLHVLLGRNFTANEDRPHGPPVVILGYAFWRHFYGGDRHVIGRSLTVEGTPHTIVGVLPPHVDLFGKVDVMLPVAFAPNSSDDGTNYLGVLRLGPDASLASVSAQVDARARAMYAQDAMPPGRRRSLERTSFKAISLKAQLHAGERGMLLMFLSSALLVLLIAIINLGNLMLLRALARGHDGAVRRALGASLLRQALPVLADALLVGLGASVIGVLMATSGLKLLRHMVAPDVVDLHAATLGVGTAGLAMALGVASALVAAALGVWRSRKLSDPDRLREGGRSGIGRADQKLGRALVVAQVTMATVLLVASGVFLHALYDAAHAQLGFRHRHILTFALAPVTATYPDARSVHDLSQQVLDGLQALPGVEAVAATTNLPVGQQFNIGGVYTPAGHNVGSIQFRAVSPGFFSTFGIPVRQGRDFSVRDIRGGMPVAIVNRAFARRSYGGHALGQFVDIQGKHGKQAARIVGVVGNTSQYGPLWSPPAILYRPLAQTSDELLGVFRSFEPMRFSLRVNGQPSAYRDAVRRAVAVVAPTQPIANMRTLTSILDGQTAGARTDLLLIGVFAALALVLASAGLYAVMAVSVAAREQELGVRMAMGAAPGRLMRLVLGGGLLQVGLGLALGLAAAVLGARPLRVFMMNTLGRTDAFDPMAMGGVALLLVLVGLLACLRPALHASRTSPMHALRGE